MGDQIGIVLKRDRNGSALVVTDRKGACGGCQSGPSACRACLTGTCVESNVSNPIDAQIGDIVKISLPSVNLVKGAAIMYLLPIGALILGAISGMWLGAEAGWSESTGPILGSLAGICAGFGAVVALGRSHKLCRQMTPSIVSIVTVADTSMRQSVRSCCG